MPSESAPAHSDTEREFTARPGHPYLLFAVPFGLFLIAAAVGAALEAIANPAYWILVACCCSFGGAVLHSCAFQIWGRLTIKRIENRISITRSLGRWSRSRELFSSQILSIARDTPGPGLLVWPGSAGPQLLVVVERRDLPLRVGEGLCLDDADLNTIEQLLSRQG